MGEKDITDSSSDDIIEILEYVLEETISSLDKGCDVEEVYEEHIEGCIMDIEFYCELDDFQKYVTYDLYLTLAKENKYIKFLDFLEKKLVELEDKKNIDPNTGEVKINIFNKNVRYAAEMFEKQYNF